MGITKGTVALRPRGAPHDTRAPRCRRYGVRAIADDDLAFAIRRKHDVHRHESFSCEDRCEEAFENAWLSRDSYLDPRGGSSSSICSKGPGRRPYALLL